MVDGTGISMPLMWLETTEDWWDSIDEETREQYSSFADEIERAVKADLETCRKHRNESRRLHFDVECAEPFQPALTAMAAWLDKEFWVSPMRHVDEAVTEVTESGNYSRHEWTLNVCAHVMGSWKALTDGYNQTLQFIADQFKPVHKVMAPGSSPFKAQAYELLPDAKRVVDSIFRIFTETPLYFFWESQRRARPKICVFTEHMRRQLNANHEKYCGERKVNPKGARPLHFDASPKELVHAYFKGTPLLEFFNANVPIRWQMKDRFDHTHIMARTKSGKTTLMERMIIHDCLSPEQPSLVVMTPHADLIRKLRDADAPFADRVIAIEPTDKTHPAAINPFAPKGRAPSVNQIIETFDYILASLGLEFTSKQSTLWKHTIRMMLKIPETSRDRPATVEDVRDFMFKPEAFIDAINLLPPKQATFFTEGVLPEFDERGKQVKKTFDPTRDEIGYRLDDLLFDEGIGAILGAKETKLDFYHELQFNRPIILVDTSKRALLGESSTLLGGAVISMVYQAMLARDAIANEDDRYPTFFYIDEMQNYFSQDIAEMFFEMRKFRCGLILSHHELEQANTRGAALGSALVSQPGIRFLRPSGKDVNALAAEIGCKPYMLQGIEQWHFAMHITDVTPFPVDVMVDVLDLPTKGFARREAFKWKNRDKISLGPNEALPSKKQPRPASPQQPVGGLYDEV